MPIEGGFVGMVDREVFDEWLRDRAARGRAPTRATGKFERLTRDADGTAVVHYRPKGGRRRRSRRAHPGRHRRRRRAARRSAARSIAGRRPHALRLRLSRDRPLAVGKTATSTPRCDVYYRGALSPDFYGWMFPHGDTMSVGTGSAHKGFSLQSCGRWTCATATGLGGAETIRREGAPIPLKPLRRWDNGRDVVLAGDAAGVVAPASGEGIYYAMLGGRLAAEAVDEFLRDRRRARAGKLRASAS